MKVIFEGVEHEVKSDLAGLYVLDNGHVVSRDDCKPVKEKAQGKAEQKPNKSRKTPAKKKAE